MESPPIRPWTRLVRFLREVRQELQKVARRCVRVVGEQEGGPDLGVGERGYHRVAKPET